MKHFLVASPDVLPLRLDFCHPGPRTWQSASRDAAIFFLSFSGVQRILGYVRPRRIVAVHPPERRKRRLHLEEPSNWDSLLQMLLWRMQTLNWDTAGDMNQRLCLNSGAAPPKEPSFTASKGRLLQRDLQAASVSCEMGQSSLRSISWLRHQMFTALPASCHYLCLFPGLQKWQDE